MDLDSQGNAKGAIGYTEGEGNRLYRALIGHARPEDKIKPTRITGLSIIPGDLDLAGAEIEVARFDDHLTRLRDVMKTIPVSAPFDYAFLDCPPSLGILMTNALAAADELIIPLQCEYLALDALSNIIQLIDLIRMVNTGLAS